MTSKLSVSETVAETSSFQSLWSTLHLRVQSTYSTIRPLTRWGDIIDTLQVHSLVFGWTFTVILWLAVKDSLMAKLKKNEEKENLYCTTTMTKKKAESSQYVLTFLKVSSYIALRMEAYF